MQQNRWLRKLNEVNANPPQWSRRLLVVLWLFSPAVFCVLAMIDLRPWFDDGRLYGAGSCLNCFTAVMLVMLNRRSHQRALLGASLDDLARIVYAKPYVDLNEMQRDRVKWRWSQQIKKGDSTLDERELAMQREAEKQAFRILRCALPVVLIVFWVVCLCAPIGQMRVGLLLSAVLISALVALVVLLPAMIRVWMEPQAAGEPEIAVGNDV